ncbi:MAG TPA: 3-deoxy-7-phosphoheptulonate synthase [Kofleriaceae bacterium]|nr:3-deoxy-7-phosphoheptulonate synthase [Kofleriaceae bacterium]
METPPSEPESSLPTPAALIARLPVTARSAATVSSARRTVRDALRGRDPRFIAIVGPCSLHDVRSALEYGERLAALRAELGGTLVLIMRTYFEKPRTSIGWKGMINDPHLDGSCDLALGLQRAREILCALNELGVPCASELLDPIVRHYLSDLLAWACIGARTSESQIHREMASGLALPVAIKNPTSGDLAPAVDALRAARSPHRHLGIDAAGGFARIETPGNPDAHLVLRGGAAGPNFAPSDIAQVAGAMAPFGLARPVLVDCSHGNSGKRPERQPDVLRAVVEQFARPGTPILGAMLESHLVHGRQEITCDAPLSYGVSLTDPCLGWDETEAVLRAAAARVRARLAS